MSEVEMSNPSTDSNYSWARAFRDIGVNAINTGQFPFFCLFVLALLILIKMPGADVSILVNDVFHNFKSYALSGYFLFALALLLGGIYIKVLQSAHRKQIEQRDNMIRSLNGDANAEITQAPITMIGDPG
ncbi:MAG: hypothetical protein VX125_12335 [Pseudomonadota bacterium]|uniref:hypothetical protein n=1 Tax=Acinetobacter bereziniae TaxID=106648 RepID=UPI002EAB7C08|nr:hypothetical protein [Pseudomonadota bacterium]